MDLILRRFTFPQSSTSHLLPSLSTRILNQAPGHTQIVVIERPLSQYSDSPGLHTTHSHRHQPRRYLQSRSARYCLDNHLGHPTRSSRTGSRVESLSLASLSRNVTDIPRPICERHSRQLLALTDLHHLDFQCFPIPDSISTALRPRNSPPF